MKKTTYFKRASLAARNEKMIGISMAVQKEDHFLVWTTPVELISDRLDIDDRKVGERVKKIFSYYRVDVPKSEIVTEDFENELRTFGAKSFDELLKKWSLAALRLSDTEFEIIPDSPVHMRRSKGVVPMMDQAVRTRDLSDENIGRIVKSCLYWQTDGSPVN